MEEWLINRMKNRPRICIFCGDPPRDKNNEHVIPQWLIELTGDPNRDIILGPFVSLNLLTPKSDLFRSFSFDSLQFPSCMQCNTDFADLEALAQSGMSKLVRADPLSAYDFMVILDWFDKVRIGLWLGYHYFLDHNYWGVLPKFHIRDRVGATDRALSIIRATNFEPGIRFSGVNTPAFAHMPSCFTLTINEWFVVNVSYQFLLSKAAGFPYPHYLALGSKDELIIELHEGTGELSSPLLPLEYDRSGTTIGQSILPDSLPSLGQVEDGSTSEIQLINDFTPSAGPVIIETKDTAEYYPLDPSDKWVPPATQDFYEMQYQNSFETLGIQNQLIERIPVSDSVPAEQKKYMETNFENCVEANDKMLKWLSEADQEDLEK